jgi:hypothetical protein
MQKYPQMGSSFISTGSGWPSQTAKRAFSCHFVMSMKSGAPRESCHICCDLSLYLRSNLSTAALPSSLVFFAHCHCFAMPTKKDPRNEVGAIVHAVAFYGYWYASAQKADLKCTDSWKNKMTLKPMSTIPKKLKKRALSINTSCVNFDTPSLAVASRPPAHTVPGSVERGRR